MRFPPISDEERKRIARDPVIDFLRRQALQRTIKWDDAEEAVMLGRGNVNDSILHRYRPACLHRARLARGHAERFRQFHARGGSDQLCSRLAHDLRGIVKMIDMSMSDENGIDLRMIPEPLRNQLRLGNGPKLQRDPEQILSRKIWIDEERRIARLEQICICPEISNFHSVARRSGDDRRRIGLDQVGIFF